MIRRLKFLLILQIICSLIAFGGLERVSYVVLALDKATPTCPQGAESMLIPGEIRQQCTSERRVLYLPMWAIPAIQGGMIGSTLCVLSSVVIWLVYKLRGAESGKWKALGFQLGMYLAFLILYDQTVYPWSVKGVFEIVLYGLERVP